jgi:hypothetical protein
MRLKYLFSQNYSIRVFAAAMLAAMTCRMAAQNADIPLPEHPRPDFQREAWINLNGPWHLRFDAEKAGEKESWFDGKTAFPESIMVPFPWGSALSLVKDKAPIAWYQRTLKAPAAWTGKKVFLTVGACDWETKVWLDGHFIGSHQGGYTPFDLDLTPHIKPGQDQRLTVRADDAARAFKLEGKQGYGNARGIWQTVYLEARSPIHLETIHFTPDIDKAQVQVKAVFAASTTGELALEWKNGPLHGTSFKTAVADAKEIAFTVPIEKVHLWSLEDPFLYEVDAVLKTASAPEDRVSTYFGMRKIGIVKLPGSDFPYFALNNKPVYLQITLDQCYHPEGFYTFPSDAFMRDEIVRSKQIGLNAIRTHVKVELPRKLYWADRLGLLVMADVPNSWGTPDADMRKDTETALRGMIRRDYNHPSIFSWIVFNETWGLFSKDKIYTPETQKWVDSMRLLAKQLDASRPVEDNSTCNYDHVATDINSWHSYLPGYAWREHLDQVCRDTFPGSKWNYAAGHTQGNEPLLNSECGNVWGYEGSTGDVDYSWDYHIMMNEFRRHPKICGWLYTEHHDVINEWNGYYRFDRTAKETGLGDLVQDMSLADWHGPFYLAAGAELCRDVKPGEKVTVPLWASFLTDRCASSQLTLKTELYGWDSLGRRELYSQAQRQIPFTAWMSQELAPLETAMPNKNAVVILALRLEDASGNVLHRNFTTFSVADGAAPRLENTTFEGAQAHIVRFAPDSFKDAKWSKKQWNVLDGLKVNGAGHGYFEYRVKWPKEVVASQLAGAIFKMEASAKQLFGKDKDAQEKQEGDYMRGKGMQDPSLNPNSYPMTDTRTTPSAVRIRIGGTAVETALLPDDPADHRGILSWHSQKKDKKLREAGSYGYLVSAQIPKELLTQAAAAGELIVRLEVDEAMPGGLAIYGERFGRYPIDPTLIFLNKN